MPIIDQTDFSAVNFTYPFIDGRRMFQANIVCTSCSAPDSFKMRRVLPPEIIEKHFKEMGWYLRGRDKWTCPDCVKSHKTSIEKETRSMTTQPAQAAPQKAASATQKVGIKEIVAVSTALELYFDRSGCRYTKGYNDERISMEIGVPIETVISVRREAFGDLVVDQGDITELRAECGRIVDSFTATRRELADGVRDIQIKITSLQGELDHFRTAKKGEIDRAVERLAVVQRKLNELEKAR